MNLQGKSPDGELQRIRWTQRSRAAFYSSGRHRTTADRIGGDVSPAFIAAFEPPEAAPLWTAAGPANRSRLSVNSTAMPRLRGSKPHQRQRGATGRSVRTAETIRHRGVAVIAPFNELHRLADRIERSRKVTTLALEFGRL
jgi:hypothetical protein